MLVLKTIPEHSCNFLAITVIIVCAIVILILAGFIAAKFLRSKSMEVYSRARDFHLIFDTINKSDIAMINNLDTSEVSELTHLIRSKLLEDANI